MRITNASSPAGLTLLSLGIDQLIDSSTRRTQKPIYHRQGFYPAAAAVTGRKSIYSYQLIRQQVTTEIREHAQYKPKLWLEKMETLMLMWDGIGGWGWGGYTKKRSTQKDICHCTIMDQTDSPLYSVFNPQMMVSRDVKWIWLETRFLVPISTLLFGMFLHCMFIVNQWFLGCHSSNLISSWFSSSKFQAKKKIKNHINIEREEQESPRGFVFPSWSALETEL